jgi:hypothetical protein
MSALLGALIGGVLVVVAELYRGKSTRAAQREDRSILAKQARVDFQRETLLALQVACREWIWSELDVHQEWKETGACHEATMAKCVKAAGHASDLMERTLDDELRGLLRELKKLRDQIDKNWNDNVDRQVDGFDIGAQSEELITKHAEMSVRLGFVLREYLKATP